MKKPDQIGEIFRNVQIVSAFRIGTGRAFLKAGPDIEKALTRNNKSI